MKKLCIFFKKSFALIVIMLISYNGLAQDYTYNVGYGNNKVYFYASFIPYVANIISSKDNTFAKELMADKITICYKDVTGSLSPSYGYFIEFTQSGQPAMITEEFEMMVLNGSILSLVSFDDDNYGNVIMKKIGTITNDLDNRGMIFRFLL